VVPGLLVLLARIRSVARRPAPHHPADRRSSRNACRECCRNGFKRMPWYSLSCVIEKLCGGMAAMFCNTPRCFATILKRIRNGGRRSRSLARCLVNLYAHLFQH
jgi:hypothetical protein